MVLNTSSQSATSKLILMNIPKSEEIFFWRIVTAHANKHEQRERELKKKLIMRHN